MGCAKMHLRVTSVHQREFRDMHTIRKPTMQQTPSRSCSATSQAAPRRTSTYPEDSLFRLLSRGAPYRYSSRFQDSLTSEHARGSSPNATTFAPSDSSLRYDGSKMSLVDIIDEALLISEAVQLSTRSRD
jgi:hypothetical protein